MLLSMRSVTTTFLSGVAVFTVNVGGLGACGVVHVVTDLSVHMRLSNSLRSGRSSAAWFCGNRQNV